MGFPGYGTERNTTHSPFSVKQMQRDKYETDGHIDCERGGGVLEGEGDSSDEGAMIVVPLYLFSAK